ncbi:MAG: hypothetical protein ACYDAG_12165 [Chloroflexota bacterium]
MKSPSGGMVSQVIEDHGRHHQVQVVRLFDSQEIDDDELLRLVEEADRILCW